MCAREVELTDDALIETCVRLEHTIRLLFQLCWSNQTSAALLQSLASRIQHSVHGLVRYSNVMLQHESISTTVNLVILDRHLDR